MARGVRTQPPAAAAAADFAAAVRALEEPADARIRAHAEANAEDVVSFLRSGYDAPLQAAALMSTALALMSLDPPPDEAVEARMTVVSSWLAGRGEGSAFTARPIAAREALERLRAGTGTDEDRALLALARVRIAADEITGHDLVARFLDQALIAGDSEAACIIFAHPLPAPGAAERSGERQAADWEALARLAAVRARADDLTSRALGWDPVVAGQAPPAAAVPQRAERIGAGPPADPLGPSIPRARSVTTTVCKTDMNRFDSGGRLLRDAH